MRYNKAFTIKEFYMKLVLAIATLVLSHASVQAEPMHSKKSIYVPSGLYYQRLSFSELRGIDVNAKTKTAQWIERNCDVVLGSCSETRSKSIPVRYTATTIEVPAVSEEFETGPVISFEYLAESRSLFHSSQGDYVKAPEVLRLTK